jgi:hypothetical protein
LVIGSGGGSPKGSNETRNGEYTPALSLLLERMARHDMDLSRFGAAPDARLGHFPFESDRAFPTQC